MNDFIKGETVKFSYAEEECIGEVYSVYGDTVNVIWDGKHTGLFYKALQRV